MPAVNPVIYFEIPVTDMQRAQKFYTEVFDFHFEPASIDGYEMMYFPFYESSTGITGALAKGDVYQPSKKGIIIYFRTHDIDRTLAKVVASNGKILYPKTINDTYGFIVAEFEDSEGNRIALHQLINE
ncbi:VOC family protein [Polluticaenibacter yanchengensis]|uniref:VOC family protein n=1 Tax=Polluticaenibacter yanchengensis TaxID=3014562 RepID=A0ABT4UH88_9BACT|nr:VOC family protein [Chitinophagaceae bacterium LY-5]